MSGRHPAKVFPAHVSLDSHRMVQGLWATHGRSRSWHVYLQYLAGEYNFPWFRTIFWSENQKILFRL